MKLHRFHCAPQATRVHVALPEHEMTWRADGRAPLDLKRDVAHRLAVCWNVLEGVPTEVLLQGHLLEMCMAIDAGDLERAKAALAKLDRGSDWSDGRPHDCPGCLEREASETDAPVLPSGGESEVP